MQRFAENQIIQNLKVVEYKFYKIIKFYIFFQISIRINYKTSIDRCFYIFVQLESPTNLKKRLIDIFDSVLKRSTVHYLLIKISNQVQTEDECTQIPASSSHWRAAAPEKNKTCPIFGRKRQESVERPIYWAQPGKQFYVC